MLKAKFHDKLKAAALIEEQIQPEGMLSLNAHQMKKMAFKV